MFSNLSNLKQMVVNVSSTLTQSDTVQNVKERVVSIPTQTKQYFYPQPEQYEMRSVVCLDEAFFVQKDIEEYTTPGLVNQAQSTNTNTLNTSPILKPRGDAISITSWHDFELCVEDESLFDETEISSYTTTNYSVTTAATSIFQSPRYNTIKQSTLAKLNAVNDDPEDAQDLNENIDLNLDEDNPHKLFQNLHKFRKSFIAKRKASGVHDLDDNTAFSAPPTSRSDGSYHRRLHTLDLDKIDLDKMHMMDESEVSELDDEHYEEKKHSHCIAPEHSDDNKPSTPIMTIQHAIEGSRELGIDDIGVINDITDDDDNTIEENLYKSPKLKHLRNISIKKKSQCDETSTNVEFELDIDHSHSHVGNGNHGNVDMDSGDFMELQNHFSVQRKLNGPRGSMKVTRISVSDEVRDTLIHQKSIALAGGGGGTEAPLSASGNSSPSSFGNQQRNDLGDYVKRVSLTPRGVDPDNAKVFVIEEKYDAAAEYLKSKNVHKRSDSMDTQPDSNQQAPYIGRKQLSEFVREHLNDECKMNMLSSDESDMDDAATPPPRAPLGGHKKSILVRQESTQFYDGSLDIMFAKRGRGGDSGSDCEETPNEEGWEQPTGYHDNSEQHQHVQDEKYDEYDGYSDTNAMDMTMGGGLSTLQHIPWNEDEYLPQELDESYNERIIPRFNISPSLNSIIRFHVGHNDADTLLKCDIIIIPITYKWTPISTQSHMLMNAAGSEYLEYLNENKKRGHFVSTGNVDLCKPYNLPCKFIIHCVPPKYDDRYPVASENAINSCYWRSLELASDLCDAGHAIKSILFPAIYPPRFFSEQLAIHILARTLRRFLERYHESVLFEAVVVCVNHDKNVQLYTRIFTIYFPRDALDLKYSSKYMPAYTGNVSGGTCVKLRKQYIELSPLSSVQPNVSIVINRSRRLPNYETYDIYGNLRASLQCMVEYKAEPEKVWKLQEKKKWGWQKAEESFAIKYQRYWNRCRKFTISQCLNQMNLYQFVYVGGQDRDGRDIVVFVGQRFPARVLMKQGKLKQALLYIIRELHHIVDRDYVVIYLHSYLNEESNLPPVSWINQCFQVCAGRFSKNLLSFYVIHPNFRLKSWFYILSNKMFYQKIIYLDSITKLEHCNIDLEHVALPGKAWEYERELFGEEKLADKMALATDDLVLDALPYR